MKYDIYSSITHGNMIEQQMPGIHCTQSDRIYTYGHDIEFTFTLYIFYSFFA